MNEYDQQAADFLSSTDTEFKAEFLGNRKHFDSDEETRDVYRITLKRNGKSCILNFGQSVSCSQPVRLNRLVVEGIPKSKPLSWEKPAPRIALKFQEADQISKVSGLTREQSDFIQRKILETFPTTNLEMGINGLWKGLTIDTIKGHLEQGLSNNRHKINVTIEWKENKDFSKPTPYDVLTCLTKYDPGTFEDFCGDFGYDEDSRAAERTYNAAKHEFNQLQTLYSDAELELMTEIQ